MEIDRFFLKYLGKIPYEAAWREAGTRCRRRKWMKIRQGILIITFFAVFMALAGCAVQKDIESPESAGEQEIYEWSDAMIGCREGDNYYVPQTRILRIPANENGESMGWIEGAVMTENYLYYIYRPVVHLSPDASDGAVQLYRVRVDEIFADYVLSGAYPKVRAAQSTKSLSLPEGLLEARPGQYGEYIQRFFADAKGQLYFLCASINQTEEGAPYHLYQCDGDGNVIKDIYLAGTLEGFVREEMVEENYLNRHPSVVDEEGKLYITQADGKQIWILNEMGELLCRLDFPQYVLKSLAAAADGKVYGIVKEGEESSLVIIDAKKQELEKLFALPGGEENGFLAADKEGALFYGSQTGWYACHIEQREAEKLFHWADLGINGKEIQSALLMDFSLGNFASEPFKAADFSAVLTLESAAKLTLTSGLPMEEIPDQREQIVLGVPAADSDLKDKVEEFNRRSFYYEVTIKEYGTDNGAQRMANEIFTGKGPDLFPLSMVDVPVFLNQGLLADFSPFLEDRKGLEREDLVEAVLRCNTQDNVLFSIPASFSLDVLIGKASTLPKSGSWTMEEYLDYVDSHRGAEVAGGSYVVESEADAQVVLALVALQANMEYFVNWEKGEAHFDSPQFLHLMQFAKDYHADIRAMRGLDVLSLVQEGKVLFYNRNISTMDDYLTCQAVLEGDAGFIGYPTADGSPYYRLQGWDAYGIRANSGKQEGAWAFIEFLLTAFCEGQEENKKMVFGFPAMADSFEAMLQKSMVKEYQKGEMGDFRCDANGNPIEIPKESKQIAGETYQIYAAAKEDAAAFRELVEKASASRGAENTTVSQIVGEELIYYMDGRKTAEQAVEIIQNRVQLFLNEQQ